MWASNQRTFGLTDQDPGVPDRRFLSAVAETGGNRVERELNPACDPSILRPGTMPTQQFDLHDVQRVEVREPISNAAGEGWVVHQGIV